MKINQSKKLILIIMIFFILAITSFLLIKNINSKNIKKESKENNQNQENISQPLAQPSPLPTITIENCTFIIETAISPEQKQQGLSQRQSLNQDSGMLFIFDQKNKYGFWMKDMNFALDFVWISDDKIVDLSENVPIFKNNQITKIIPKNPVNKVLEINAGMIKQCQISKNSIIKFN